MRKFVLLAVDRLNSIAFVCLLIYGDIWVVPD